MKLIKMMNKTESQEKTKEEVALEDKLDKEQSVQRDIARKELSEANIYYRSLSTQLVTICVAIIAFPTFVLEDYLTNPNYSILTARIALLLVMMLSALTSIFFGLLQFWIDHRFHRRKARFAEKLVKMLKKKIFEAWNKYVDYFKIEYKDQKLGINSNEAPFLIQIISAFVSIISLSLLLLAIII